MNNKADLLQVLSDFSQKYHRKITDTDDMNFNPRSNEILGLLDEWRLVFDLPSGMARMKIEELIRNFTVVIDANELVAALKKAVPGSTPEKDITTRLEKVFSKMSCDEPKKSINLNDACGLALELAEYPILSSLLKKVIAKIIFKQGEPSDLLTWRAEVEKTLADFKKRRSAKNSVAYSLFCWLEDLSGQMGSELCLWPVRQSLLNLMANPDTRPRFEELLMMWKKSVRFLELQGCLKNAMLEEIALIQSHQVDLVPSWFLAILKKPEDYPHFLFTAVSEKVKDLMVFLGFETNTDPSTDKPVAESATVSTLGVEERVTVGKKLAKTSLSNLKERVLTFFP